MHNHSSRYSVFTSAIFYPPPPHCTTENNIRIFSTERGSFVSHEWSCWYFPCIWTSNICFCSMLYVRENNTPICFHCNRIWCAFVKILSSRGRIENVILYYLLYFYLLEKIWKQYFSQFVKIYEFEDKNNKYKFSVLYIKILIVWGKI